MINEENKALLDAVSEICNQYICPLSARQCCGNRCPCLTIDHALEGAFTAGGIVICTVECRSAALSGDGGAPLGLIYERIAAGAE